MGQSLTAPPKGSMYLFNYLTPPLTPGDYRMVVETEVSYDDKVKTMDDERYFQVVGPRFTLDPNVVAGVFPPRNGHGPFQDNLAHVALKRRTLPWERPLDANNPIQPDNDGHLLPANYPVPWMALLLFEEGEYTLIEGAPLENVVPESVFKDLGSPANILCNAVEAERDLVRDIIPSKEELQLLTHLRWVNIEDRELNVEGSDGWFAVVMTNRIPTPGAKCRACLVSLEERSDLVHADPPETYLPGTVKPHFEFHPLDVEVIDSTRRILTEHSLHADYGKLVSISSKVRLVLLYSWQFTCEGEGTFFNLMQKLDVGMIGKVKKEGEPALTDTGHLRIELQDRAGTQETALYRGPLAPFPLTRDTLGPYHSADQCRRATPEIGVEDVSYAAAFEVGRLLAAADARLAQELMRWRRDAFKQSARADIIIAIEKYFDLELPDLLVEKLHEALVPIVAVSVLDSFVNGIGPVADSYGIKVASQAVGLNPKVISKVWDLASEIEAQTLLADAAALGAEVEAPLLTPRPDETLGSVLADTVSLERLSRARARLIDNAKIKVGGKI
jgi:hypothetical protein